MRTYLMLAAATVALCACSGGSWPKTEQTQGQVPPPVIDDELAGEDGEAPALTAKRVAVQEACQQLTSQAEIVAQEKEMVALPPPMPAESNVEHFDDAEIKDAERRLGIFEKWVSTTKMDPCVRAAYTYRIALHRYNIEGVRESRRAIELDNKQREEMERRFPTPPKAS